MLESLLKFQYPHPYESGFQNWNTKPFINTLRLIKKVNELCHERGLKEKGISNVEFGIFALSLKNFNDVDEVAENILLFRDRYESYSKESDRNDFRDKYIESYLSEFNNPVQNVKEYTDKGIDLEVSNVLAKITNNTDEGIEYIKEGKIIDIIDLVKKINRSIVLNENPYLKFYEASRFLFDDNNKKNHQMFMDLLILITNDRIYKILGRDDEITFTNEIENLVNDMEMDYQKTFSQLEKIIEFKGRMKYNLNLDLMYMQMFIEIMR